MTAKEFIEAYQRQNQNGGQQPKAKPKKTVTAENKKRRERAEIVATVIMLAGVILTFIEFIFILCIVL